MKARYEILLNEGKQSAILRVEDGQAFVQLGINNVDGSTQFSVEAPLQLADLRILGDLFSNFNFYLEDEQRRLEKKLKPDPQGKLF